MHAVLQNLEQVVHCQNFCFINIVKLHVFYYQLCKPVEDFIFLGLNLVDCGQIFFNLMHAYWNLSKK